MTLTTCNHASAYQYFQYFDCLVTLVTNKTNEYLKSPSLYLYYWMIDITSISGANILKHLRKPWISKP